MRYAIPLILGLAGTVSGCGYLVKAPKAPPAPEIVETETIREESLEEMADRLRENMERNENLFLIFNQFGDEMHTLYVDIDNSYQTEADRREQMVFRATFLDFSQVVCFDFKPYGSPDIIAATVKGRDHFLEPDDPVAIQLYRTMLDGAVNNMHGLEQYGDLAMGNTLVESREFVEAYHAAVNSFRR